MMTADTSSKKKSACAFSNYKATAKLKTLAKEPFDLTKEGNLTPDRITKYCAHGCGYKLFYGTERITDEVMSALQELAQEAKALEKMKKMQAGEVLNFIEGYPSENRPVLHTALRDFFEAPNSGKAAVEAATAEKVELNHLQKFMQKIDQEGKFTDLISIAIGGSDLGPKALYLSLQHLRKPNRRVHYISNLDPDDIAQVLREVDLTKTLVMVGSKSGTTIETVANEEFVRACFKEAGLKPKEHFISVTGKGSPIDNPKEYLACFHIWDYIGGRFCGTSLFGGIALSFACGYDVYWDLLRGANAMDKLALNPDINQNLPLLLALLAVWNHNFLHYPTLCLVPYSQALWRFSAHIQQVEMESNGKRIDKRGHVVDFDTGSIIWGEPGTSAQHSFYQLIHQGTAVIPMELIGFKESQYGKDHQFQGTTNQEKLLSNLFAQTIALAVGQKSDNPNKVFPGNRPSCLLLGKRLTAYAMGALFALYEHKVAFEGFIWDINSFDQEGVQLGKVLANKVISRFAAGRAHDKKAEPFPLGDAYLKELESI